MIDYTQMKKAAEAFLEYPGGQHGEDDAFRSAAVIKARQS